MGNKPAKLQLLSPAFTDGAPIPPQHTCKGDNVNPPLVISGVPTAAKSLALVMHDPDAIPVAGIDFVHWLMWDIPTSIETIKANAVPVGAIQGKNSRGENKYTGPCPPVGTGVHHYPFELYVLDTALNLPAASERATLEAAIKGHVLAHTTLTGTFATE